MAEYYKWYTDLISYEYVFAIPINIKNSVVTITMVRESLEWKIEATYIPPERWVAMRPVDSTDKKAIYNTLKGQKGEIITKIFAKIFALRQ